ncbi:polyketide cyclase dehydrase [Fusarium tjaetaba]|uniref:Polyketide cyclase dehydrase n=1 Tax=Fusarium tjaetaba TaxID=1567544 RepID=A0A8H5W781_9HYPO|nr:polyketide cyclase dehydrase [Fusarium tjaetaba]KAF5647808.1 polyketide cyclase dehydrase [Fusarium tjaetaba]
MAQHQLDEYVCVTREINAPVAEVWGMIAGFGAEKAWYPGCLRLSVEGFGIGSTRTFDYEYPEGEHKGERYTFSEEMTEVDAANHSMTLRVRRPDYPDMIAYGTTILDSLGPNKTQFRWLANGSPLPDAYTAILRKDLDFRFNQLIDAIAAVVESK